MSRKNKVPPIDYDNTPRITFSNLPLTLQPTILARMVIALRAAGLTPTFENEEIAYKVRRCLEENKSSFSNDPNFLAHVLIIEGVN